MEKFNRSCLRNFFLLANTSNEPLPKSTPKQHITSTQRNIFSNAALTCDYSLCKWRIIHGWEICFSLFSLACLFLACNQKKEKLSHHTALNVICNSWEFKGVLHSRETFSEHLTSLWSSECSRYEANPLFRPQHELTFSVYKTVVLLLNSRAYASAIEKFHKLMLS